MRVPSQPETSMYWPIRSLASAGVRCGRCWADRRTLGASDGVATRILPIRSDRRHNKQGQRSQAHLAWTRQRQTGHRRLGPRDSRQKRQFPARSSRNQRLRSRGAARAGRGMWSSGCPLPEPAGTDQRRWRWLGHIRRAVAKQQGRGR